MPYGSWPSPITADLLVSGAANPGSVWAHDGVTWWSQSRPQEGGRIQLVRRDRDGSVHDLLPDGWNARTRVHEYGGGAWWVDRGIVYFTAWADQRLYRLGPDDAAPVPLTPEVADHALRYADGRVTPDGATVICVRQRHDDDGVSNELVAIPTDGSANGEEGGGERNASGEAGSVVVLFHDSDFVAAPRISPDGTRLAWLTWDHPRMPWDGTELWVAGLTQTAGRTKLTQTRAIAGSETESLVQPQWGPDGALYVVSDRTDWWNLYRVDVPASGLPPASAVAADLVPVCPLSAEIVEPAWVFGASDYTIAADAVWFSYAADGRARLVRVPTNGADTVDDRALEASSLHSLRLDATAPDGPRLVAIAHHLDREPEVVQLPLPTGSAPQTLAALQVLAPARDLELPDGVLSRPRHVTFPSAHGRSAHAWFYPPAGANPTPLTGVDDELPPLIVMVHGGPTAAADPSFDLRTQFWTSRGFAVIDVNYGGSTGYGRPFRELLHGAWGVVDIEDCSAAAQWAAAQGLADPTRLAITGGSAGGFTVLACLATTATFAAGASHYGVADLAALARDTHKFESRYLDALVGPYPQAAAVYDERSPLSHIDGFDAPLIVFQGLEDDVVPPAQAEAIVAALDAKGVPHAYLPFEGEQHGFRIAANIVRCITAELSFYGQVFGFTPAGFAPEGDLEPMALKHLG